MLLDPPITNKKITLETVKNFGDWQQVMQLSEIYNKLVATKFELQDKASYPKLDSRIRAECFFKIIELSIEIIRIDELRHTLAFTPRSKNLNF